MFKISEEANPNYLAQIVELKNLEKHPNADRLQICKIQGNNVIVSLNAKDGEVYVYFPLECSINKEFLSWSNLFSEKDLNNDKESSGFFSKRARVRAVKLRGVPSEGYAVPMEQLLNWISIKSEKEIKFNKDWITKEFDYFGDISICQKYVNVIEQRKEQNKKANSVKGTNRLIPGQFNLHIDTLHLKKLIKNVWPDDYISITKKYHGTSAVISNVLCKKPLTWVEKILKKLGIDIVTKKYDLIYSSRKVVKNGTINKYSPEFTSDIWGIVAKDLKRFIDPGITLYVEIVGYMPTGGYVQSKYDYGCEPGQYKALVYRVTHTDCNGEVFEYTHSQVKEYCNRKGLNMVHTFYYGLAKDLFPNIDIDEDWNNNFLEKMSNTYLEKKCSDCKNKVPDEGIVLRRDIANKIDVYKLKSFKFLMMETEQLDDENFID